jgi:hypothetical protein
MSRATFRVSACGRCFGQLHEIVQDGRLVDGAQQVVDNALKTQHAAVFGRIDTGHAVFVQFVHFGRHDHAATASEHPNIIGALFPEQVHDVLEKFHVAALIAAYGNALGVFLDRGGDDFGGASVVPQVDHFGPGILQYSPHNVYGCVVTVKQTGGCDDPDAVFQYIGFSFHGRFPFLGPPWFGSDRNFTQYKRCLKFGEFFQRKMPA